jgi:AcrR family transcriptional regulator
MQYPARTLRALIEDLPEAQRTLTERQQRRHALIREAGRRSFARLGPDTFSIRTFVKACWMTVSAFTCHYCDLESLLAELIRDHLFDLHEALTEIPRDDPNRAAACRAAYLQATRLPSGGLTETHILLVHRRDCLPPDLREPLDKFRAILGKTLAGDHADAAFRLLDAPELSLEEIELSLAAIAAHRAAREAPNSAPGTRSPDGPSCDTADRRVGVSPAPPQTPTATTPETPWTPPAPRPAPPEHMLRLTRSLSQIGIIPDYKPSPPPPRRRDLIKAPTPDDTS